MRAAHLIHLACPACHSDLRIETVTAETDGRLVTGKLECTHCAALYPVIRGIPRFVSSENYAASFGLEWTLHNRTQFDAHAGGGALSETRFFEETGWLRDLPGEKILEAGSGAGRFTEVAASTGAFVLSLDYSEAVEANHESNGSRENVLIVQADIYSMPVRPRYFDKIFCFGVLQHTPDVKRAFMSLPPLLKEGGSLVADVYKKTLFSRYLATKYYARRFTRDMEPARLYELTRRWVDFMWPVSRIIARIPRVGVSINWRLLVADYSHWGLTGDVLKEWAYLDTFDMLSPRYDSPQTLSTFRKWFHEAGLAGVDVRYGHNGVQGRGFLPPADAA